MLGSVADREVGLSFFLMAVCAIFLEAAFADFHFPVQQFPGQGKHILASVHARSKTKQRI